VWIRFTARACVLQSERHVNKATLPNTKTFSTAKLALCVHLLCVLLHNTFLVFNISDELLKKFAQSVDVAKSQFRVTWGFRFPSMLQRVRSISYRLVLKTKSSGRTTVQESVLFEMTDKSLRVKLVVVSLLEHNFNQRISHFRSFNSTRKVNTDERFASFSFKPNIAPPNVKLLSLFLSL